MELILLKKSILGHIHTYGHWMKPGKTSITIYLTYCLLRIFILLNHRQLCNLCCIDNVKIMFNAF